MQYIRTCTRTITGTPRTSISSLPTTTTTTTTTKATITTLNFRMSSSTSSTSIHDRIPTLGPVVDGHVIHHSTHSCTYTTTNPSTLAPVHTWPSMTSQDAETAVLAASNAFKTSWGPNSGLTPRDRSNALLRLHDAVLSRADDFAALMTLECGKPIAESRGEVAYAASFLKWFSEEAVRTYGMTIPSLVPGREYLTFKEPVGVCSMITPWNFPLAMITRKVGPAIAAGCTVVVKPAPETPAAAVYLAQVAVDCGILPPGVLNVVTASKTDSAAVGKVLSTHKDVRKISFTGSTGVGKILLSQASQTVKRTSMELGGNAPFVVFEDANIDLAVEGCVAAKFRNAGQTCVCPNRILVHEKVIDEFSQKLAKKVAQLKIGSSMDPKTEVGPLVSAAGLEKAERHVEDAIAKGGKLLTGGKRATSCDEGSLKGYYYHPTVITNVSPDAAIMTEETFGPLAGVIPFKNEEEALAMANNTVYGLASYFYTGSMARILRFGRKLESGMVGVNTGAISAENTPFGGVKESGLGREGGPTGIDEYLNVKYLSIGLKE